MRNELKNRIKHLLVIIFLMTFTGCGFWENFTTYFNRYFNAVDKFEEAEEIIQTESERDLFEFKEPRVPGKANTALDAVIKKCSEILQWNKESAYVEEAILMIGKSYYYRGNYTKALRKFRELESFPNTDLALENKLWIGKSELQMRRFEEGMQTLDDVKIAAEEEGEDEILVEAYLSQIRFLVYRENYNTAIGYANKLLDVSNSSQLSAEISYEMGKLYVLVNDYENAAEAFSNVFEYSPTFDIGFLSQVEYANVLRLLGNTEESLEILEDLRDENKYSDYRDKIELEIGNIYYAQNKLDDALSMYILVDTTYSASENAGIAAFNRAEIIEKEFFEFDSAKILYDRLNKIKAPVEYKNLAKEKSFLLTNRRRYTDQIFKFSRQLKYVRDTTLFRADSAAYENYFKMKDSLSILMTEMKELEGRDFDSSKYVLKEDPPFKEMPALPKIAEDSLVTQICLLKYELGNLYFIDLEVSDSAYAQYTGILDNYPQNKYEAKTMYALGSYYLTIDNKQKADSLFLEVYQNHNYDPIANAAAEKLGLSKIATDKDPAERKYIIAEDLYLSNKFDSAIDTLYDLSRKYPESPLAAKSLFTIGWILENDLEMPDSAAAVYDTLTTKYKRTEYASNVTKKLNAYKTWEQQVKDSLKQIEQAAEQQESGSVNLTAPLDSTVVSDSVSVADSAGTVQSPDDENSSREDSTSTFDQSTDAVKENNDQSNGVPEKRSSRGAKKSGNN